ncbi:hypothetical protein TSUD_41840 [Trifolium subterraneum]|nr:hypothetical protein TSUD_41840 [Trifolium subterraneum]
MLHEEKKTQKRKATMSWNKTTIRIKILTTSGASIDPALTVEVEGVPFSLWVIEERGRLVSKVVGGGVREDEGSVEIPSDGGGYGEVGIGDGDVSANSGEDEASGYEIEKDGDGRRILQHEERNEAHIVRPMCDQELKNVDTFLSCEKSTKNANSQKEIPAVAREFVGYEDMAIRTAIDVKVLAVSKRREEIGMCSLSGTEEREVEGSFERENHGPQYTPVDLGLEDPISDPMVPNNPNCTAVTHTRPDPVFQSPAGLAEGLRYSSVSEPEEIRSSSRLCTTKKASKLRKQKSCSKFNHIAAPKCLQLVEAIKESGVKFRRRRMKGGGAVTGGDGDLAEVGRVQFDSKEGELKSPGGRSQQNHKVRSGMVVNGQTPTSGLRLISGDSSASSSGFNVVEKEK